MAGTRINVIVDNINLFEENPRFEPVKSQREALFAILSNQKDKLFELAKDINENGINLGDLPYVIIDKSDNSFYTVLEGNRRFAAIKILENPELIKDFPENRFYTKFKKLSSEYKISSNRIIDIDCILFDSFLDAAQWIEKKHIGESGGKGTVTWVSLQSNRFKRLLTGKASVELQVADFVKAKFPEIGKNIDKIPITSLERLLGDKYVKSQLGLDVQKGVVYTTIEISEISKPLGKIVSDLIDGTIDVNNIRSTGDRKKYIDGLDAEYKVDLTKKLDLPVKLDPISATTPSTTSTKKTKKAKSPLDRTTVILHNEVIESKIIKIDILVFELKIIQADKCPISAAFLLRSLLEISVQCYLDKNPVKTKKDYLHTRTNAVVDNLKTKGIGNKSDYKGIEAWINDPASWCSINSLNAVVHSSTFIIPLTTLISGFENIKPFLILVWAETNKP
jgi:hypothetical protein